VCVCVCVCVCMLVTQSCPTLCNPMDCSPPGSSVHGILQARILEWVPTPWEKGSHSFLQGIFPTQGSNLCLLHCRQILYCLSYQGSLDQTGASCMFLCDLIQVMHFGPEQHKSNLLFLNRAGTWIKQRKYPVHNI